MAALENGEKLQVEEIAEKEVKKSAVTWPALVVLLCTLAGAVWGFHLYASGALQRQIDEKANKSEVVDMKQKIDRIYDCFLERGLVKPVKE